MSEPNEMILAVAEAMFEANLAYRDSDGRTRWTLDSMVDDSSKKYWTGLAQSALEAMRQPTNAMCQAGAERLRFVSALGCLDLWREMIDEALR